MSGKKPNKLWKRYEEMGEFIKTRNFRQCKLYHQRLVQHYETIPEIITFLAQSCPKLLEIKEREKENFFRKTN